MELKKFKEINLKEKNEKMNDKTAIKKLFLIKRTISNLKIRNPNIINQIDKIIIEELGEKRLQDEITKNYFRFIKIRNEFIYEYYHKKFNISDLKNVFKKFKSISIPISNNDCLTIDNIIDIKNYEQFYNNFLINFQNKNNNYEILIDGNSYKACINKNILNAIESEIIKYIELITEDDFKQFIYAN